MCGQPCARWDGCHGACSGALSCLPLPPAARGGPGGRCSLHRLAKAPDPRQPACAILTSPRAEPLSIHTSQARTPLLREAQTRTQGHTDNGKARFQTQPSPAPRPLITHRATGPPAPPPCSPPPGSVPGAPGPWCLTGSEKTGRSGAVDRLGHTRPSPPVPGGVHTP